MVKKFKFEIQNSNNIENQLQKNSLFFISFYIGSTFVVFDCLYLYILFASSV